MSDDLIERLRDMGIQCCDLAADRIEQLQRDQNKAIEALNYCIDAPFSGWTIAQGYARTVLAEIEKNNE